MKFRIGFWVALVLAAFLSAASISAQLTGPVVSGTIALDGSNPTQVNTGLVTMTACSVVKNTPTAPGVGASVFTVQLTPGSGLINIYAWQSTSSSVTTLVASSSQESVAWICTGRTN